MKLESQAKKTLLKEFDNLGAYLIYGMNTIRGIPDINVLCDGTIAVIELKQVGNTMTKLQEYNIYKAIKNGAVGWLIEITKTKAIFGYELSISGDELIKNGRVITMGKISEIQNVSKLFIKKGEDNEN